MGYPKNALVLDSSSRISLRGITKDFFRGVRILEAVDLDVAAGEFVSLLGPSGSGKTTLLRLIAGLIPPTAGEILIDEVPPSLARDRMSYLFQDATLLPWLNVRENIEVPLRLRGVPAQKRREVAKDFADWVNLGDFLSYLPGELSGGMQMRVSLARALSMRPSLLLLDEPFAALDEMTRHRLNEEILTLRERAPYTAVYVTHSVEEAVFLSDRIVLLAPNPARICEIVEISFESARTNALRETVAFHDAVLDVTRRLHRAAAA